MLPSPPAELETRPRSKRKIGDVEAEETRDSSFQLVNLSDDSCLNFEPICKLLRAHLPLSWLAATHTTDVIASGSLLKGAIPQITAWEYSILVARLLPNGGLYALEKVDDDCFVLHTLQPFVSSKWISDASIGAVPQVNMQMMLHYLPTASTSEALPTASRRTLSISSESELKIAKNRKGAAARLSILGQSIKHESQPASPTLNDIQTVTSPAKVEVNAVIAPAISHEKISPEVGGELGKSETTAQDDPNLPIDMLSADYLRQRYLETLYTTKSPLSYYSKGPLSRARARARAPDATLSLGELAIFYRDSLLPAKKLDLKYRQSIRDAITQIIQDSTQDVEVARTSKKRTKLGKDGLWSIEPKYIAKWWQEVQNSTKSPAALETRIGQAISSLRMREAQMQILLILETLSVEAKQSMPAPAPPIVLEALGSSDVKVESIENEAGSSVKSQKAAKRRNLETDLELLADKLCIWHSIGLEDTIHSSSPASRPEHDDTQSHSRDSLRNFCTEVLIPFYSSKLPILCKALCKTLAGPELYDRAAKAARMKDESSKAIAPGAALQRRPPSRGNTLDRVLSDGSLRHSSPPVLVRSATLPPIPHLKREKSETPQRQFNRQASMSFTNREVDLVADANVTAVKKRKLDVVAVQKQELASAIQALKKPNRQVLANSYMDDVEARKQKLKKPILITATPRAHRKMTLTDLEVAPISEPFLVPSLLASTPYSQKKKAVLAALQATPSKTLSKKKNATQAWSDIDNPSVLSTPVIEKDSFVFATPVKQNRSTAAFHTPKKSTSESELKKDDFVLTDTAFKVMDRAMKKPFDRNDESIYAKLGWEDDQLIDI